MTSPSPIARLAPDQLGGVIDLIASGEISGKIAKDLFEIVYTDGGNPAEIVESRGMKQVTDTGAIEARCRSNHRRQSRPSGKSQAKSKIGGLVCRASDQSHGRQGQSAGGQSDCCSQIGTLI